MITVSFHTDIEEGKMAWTHTPAIGRTETYFTTSPRYPESEYKSENTTNRILTMDIIPYQDISLFNFHNPYKLY